MANFAQIAIAALIAVSLGFMIFTLLPFLVTIAVMLFFLHPYIRAFQIKLAVDQNNLDQLADYIDFPLLRKNLLEQAKSRMTQTIGGRFLKSAFVVFGLNMAGFLTEKMIEALVTPIVIADLMKGSISALRQYSQVAVTSEEGEDSVSKPLENAQMGYRSFSLFSILLKTNSDQYIEFVLSRSGLDWKLTNLKFLVEETTELRAR